MYFLPDPADLLTQMSDSSAVDVASVGLLFAIGWRCASQLLHRAHVEASAERLALAREHDAPNAWFGLEAFARFSYGAKHFAVECVALVSTGETNIGNAVIDGERDAIRHACIVALSHRQKRSPAGPEHSSPCRCPSLKAHRSTSLSYLFAYLLAPLVG